MSGRMLRGQQDAQLGGYGLMSQGTQKENWIWKRGKLAMLYKDTMYGKERKDFLMRLII